MTSDEMEWVGNDTQQLALMDRVGTLELVNAELKRLLAKETHLNTLLVPPISEDNGESCSRCQRYLTAVHAMRHDNAQEHRWVEHFQKTSHCLQTQLQERLRRMETAFSALRAKYDELRRRKDDPLSKDTEVNRLRESAAEARQEWCNANLTALNANREAEALLSELMDARDRIRCLEADLRETTSCVRQQADTIDTYRRMPEFAECRVGQCDDYRCRKRDIELISGQREASEQIEALRKENTALQDRVKTCRVELFNCQQRADRVAACDPVTGLVIPPVFQIIEQRSRPLTANLEGFDDLKMNLKSFFIIFPNHDEEWEQTAMFFDFLLDLPPAEREQNISWMHAACHGGRGLSSVDCERFRKRSTVDKPEPMHRACFAACMLAIGGNFRKHGSRTIWVNVRASRAPVFKRE